MNELTQEINLGVTPPDSAPAELPSPMTIEMPEASDISPTPQAAPEMPASPIMEVPPVAAPPAVEPVPLTSIGPKVATLEMPALTPSEMAEEVKAENIAKPQKRSFWNLFQRGE